MPDGDFLEIFRTPDISVLTHRAQVKAGNPERFRADFGVPGVKAPEIEIRRSVLQLAGLDRIAVVDQEQEDIAIRRVERGRVPGDVDIGMIDACRPVERAGNFSQGIPGAIVDIW